MDSALVTSDDAVREQSHSRLRLEVGVRQAVSWLTESPSILMGFAQAETAGRPRARAAHTRLLAYSSVVLGHPGQVSLENCPHALSADRKSVV